MIKIENLSFGYRKKALLFKGLNVHLKVGHIYGLLGKNGAGKSTLLKNIAGLAFPSAGSCTVNGYRPASRLPGFLQELFFIPEELHMPPLTVKKFVEVTAAFYPHFDEGQFYNTLSEFEVPADSLLPSLSFGQQKKSMIAFGLATNTKLLIMDEPTNGLDIPSKVQFRKIISAALTDERCIVISTHQVRDLDSLIDTLLVLHKQEIILNRGLEDIANRLYFSAASRANKDKILYTEGNTIGVNTISLNTDELESKVDIEILFNALINEHSTFAEKLNSIA